jgi:hypothetical protein
MLYPAAPYRFQHKKQPYHRYGRRIAKEYPHNINTVSQHNQESRLVTEHQPKVYFPVFRRDSGHTSRQMKPPQLEAGVPSSQERFPLLRSAVQNPRILIKGLSGNEIGQPFSS